MARLPFSGLESLAAPGTIAVPDAYNRVAVDPAAFGANDSRAVEGLGKALQGAGGTAVDIAVGMQHQHDQTAVTEALNTLQAHTRMVQFGNPDDPESTGFYGTKGRDALDRFPDATGSIEDRREALKNSLQNHAQRQQFDQRSQGQTNATLETMSRHRQQQQQVWAVGTQAAARENSLRDAGLNYNDETAFRNHLADSLASQAQADQLAGAGPDVMKANAARTVSEGWQQRVRRLSDDNPLAADAMLRANMDRLLPEAQSRLMEHLKPMVDKAGAQADADTVNNRYGGTAAMRLATPAGPVPDMIKASATRQGIDPNDALVVARIESGVGTVRDRPGSQYQGVYQMGDGAWAARGGTAANRRDLSAQVDLGIANLAHSKEVATAAAGRPAAGWETYLVHQQGDGGGGALLQAASDASAVATLTPAYKGDAAKARAAVVQNGGKADMTAGQFRDLWRAKFEAAGGGGSVAGQTTPPDQPRNLEDMLTQLEPMIQGRSPEWQDRARSLVTQTWNQQQARNHGLRTSLTKRAGDVNAALADGHDVQPIEESAIRTAFAGQPEQADHLVRTQQEAQQSGQVMQSIAHASPADIQRMLTDLDTGTGPLSAMGRLRAGRTLAAGPDGKPVEPNNDPEDYRYRRGLADKLRQQVVRRAQMIQDDPASYVATNPALRDTITAASSQGATVEQRSAAVGAVLAEQERQGVPPDMRRALPRAQAASDVYALTHVDPSKADMGLLLSQKAAAYGSAWPDVFASYVHEGLPASYKALAIMDRPDQTADRADFQRALITVAEKGGVEQLRGAVGKATVKEIDDGLDDKMAPFKATTLHAQNAVQMYDSYKESVKTLAYYKAMQGSSTPLEDAYQGILGKRYDFRDAMRAPKGDMPAVRTAAQSVLGALTVADMPVLYDSTPGLTDDDKRATLFKSVRAFGQWVQAPDDGGLELIVRTNNNQLVRVSRADGTPVAVRFDKLQSYAAFGESDLGEVLRTGP